MKKLSEHNLKIYHNNCREEVLNGTQIMQPHSNVIFGKTITAASDIGKILMNSSELNANWIMSGRGNMLFDGDSPYTEGQLDMLRTINKELMTRIDVLNRKIWDLEAEIASIKKENAHLDMVADNADADTYGLAK